MTLSQIKAQVEALCRKYAKELEIYLLGKVSAEFCDEVADALTNPKACTSARTGVRPRQRPLRLGLRIVQTDGKTRLWPPEPPGGPELPHPLPPGTPDHPPTPRGAACPAAQRRRPRTHPPHGRRPSPPLLRETGAGKRRKEQRFRPVRSGPVRPGRTLAADGLLPATGPKPLSGPEPGRKRGELGDYLKTRRSTNSSFPPSTRHSRESGNPFALGCCGVDSSRTTRFEIVSRTHRALTTSHWPPRNGTGTGQML